MAAAPYIGRLVDPWLTELLNDLPAVLLLGPRACGKTTTARRYAATTLRLDQPNVCAAVAADPDAVLADADPPVLVDEWQLAPEVLAAAKRLIDSEPRAGRFLFAGSAADDAGVDQWPGTGRFIRVPLWGLTCRELEGAPVGPTFADRILDANPGDIGTRLPRKRPDTAGYVDRALLSGFPEAIARSSERTRGAWINSYIDHLVGRDVALIADVRDPRRLRRYLRAVCANTGGEPTTETLIETSDINRLTADRYDTLLERLFVAERVPPWSSNRLTRVTARPKRYVCDPAIAAAMLGVDRRAILRDGDLLGRLLDTFVAAQLRPELQLGRLPAAIYHLRHDGGRHEIDLIIERTDGSILAIEIKAGTTIDRHDARHLVWLRDRLPTERRFVGLVMHAGTQTIPLHEQIWALPICGIWGP